MKRVLLGTMAVLTAAVLPFSGAFAKDDAFDYANSIGQVDEGDTINLVVEATSDGGYVVGGITMHCYKEKIMEPNFNNLGDGGDDDEDFGRVSMDNCRAAFGDKSVNGDKGVAGAISANIASSSICRSGNMNFDAVSVKYDGYSYFIRCVDYIAKFQKNGTREWLTAISADRMPIAVGETANDYRLLLDDDSLYSFSRSGELIDDIELDYDLNENSIDVAKIDKDGFIYTTGWNGLMKFNNDGQVIATLSGEEDQCQYYNDSNKTVIMNGEIYLTCITDESMENGRIGNIVKISKNLQTVTPIIHIEKGKAIILLSSDAEGNILTYDFNYDIVPYDNGDGTTGWSWENQDEYKLISYDKDGNMLGEKDVDEDYMFNYFMPGFVVVSEDGEITKFNKNLETEFSYTLNNNEEIHGATILDDGSVVLVGGSTSSTDNYEVTGDQNGIQIRLDVKGGEDEPQPDDGGVVNPGTLDGIQIIMLISGIALLCGGIASRKLTTRR